MKSILVFIILLISCSLNNTKENYYSQFKDIELPLTINRANLFDFNKMVFDKVSDTHKKNIFPILDSSYYKYIYKIDAKNNIKVDYRCLYKFDITEANKAVIIIEDFLEDGDIKSVWFKLYTYGNKGGIIDCLLLGGYEIDYKEQFFTIDKELTIKTTMFEFLPPPDNDNENIYAKKIDSKYKIVKTGKIIKNEQKEKKAKFIIADDGYIELIAK